MARRKSTRTPVRAPQSAPVVAPPEFFLTVPCQVGKPDRKTPELLVTLGEHGKVLSACYQCRECTMIFYSRKSWMKHAGMVTNIMGFCTGEKVATYDENGDINF
jgi:hypothetical protein